MKELKEMIALMQENGLSELEIEKNGIKVRLKKSGGGFVRSGGDSGEVRMISEEDMEAALQSGDKVAKEPEGTVIVRSPMVGTFYSAPAPDKPVYVTKGAEVKEDDVLCIVEAMKLMNEIKSEMSGRIIDILVANGQPVEFDQPLFKIQRA